MNISIMKSLRVPSMISMLVLLLAGCAAPRSTPDAAHQDGPGATSAAGASTDADGFVPLRLIALNDFHGNLEGPAGQVRVGEEKIDAGGVANIKAYVDKLRADHPNSIVVAAGDLIGASPLVSSIFHDEPTIEAMNQLGLELSAVGNHEFDQGREELLRKQRGGCHPTDTCTDAKTFKGATFEYLAANVVDEQGETLFPAYRIKTFDNIRVGFIGLVLEDAPDIISPSAVKGLTFLNEAQVINEVTEKLQKEGVEAIVVLIHEGAKPTSHQSTPSDCGDAMGPVMQIVQQTSDAVDVFITGHTHQNYICTVNGKLVTSARSYGRLLTEINLKLDPKTGDIVDKKAVNHVIRGDELPADAQMTALVEHYLDASSEVAKREVGRITESITRDPNEAGESALGDVVADSQLAATRAAAQGGAQIAFMNPGGIRANLTMPPGMGAAAAVTYADLHRVLPFGNTLVTMTLTGTQIAQLLEQQWAGEYPMILQISQGFSYAFNPDGEVGALVDPASITLNGQKVDPAASYRVTVNDFMADGGDGFTVLTEGTDRVTGPSALDVFIAYFGEKSPVRPGAQNRILIKR